MKLVFLVLTLLSTISCGLQDKAENVEKRSTGGNASGPEMVAASGDQVAVLPNQRPDDSKTTTTSASEEVGTPGIEDDATIGDEIESSETTETAANDRPVPPAPLEPPAPEPPAPAPPAPAPPAPTPPVPPAVHTKLTFSWGENTFGQLGVGGTGTESSPKVASGQHATNVSVVGAGEYHSFIVSNARPISFTTFSIC